ncbi:hypothetical protein BJY01DRAFT_226759 [Aspergillus pseudoustus]|uniref:Secreted protein n=1 Tax=Aspergillus pseudoustus TaxID=1810923 RepID=A0ABR4IU15_9EURO
MQSSRATQASLYLSQLLLTVAALVKTLISTSCVRYRADVVRAVFLPSDAEPRLETTGPSFHICVWALRGSDQTRVVSDGWGESSFNGPGIPGVGPVHPIPSLEKI